MELNSRGPGWQSEVQAIDQTGPEQRRKPPQRRLGLTGTRGVLDRHQRAERRIAHGGLQRCRREGCAVLVLKQVTEAGRSCGYGRAPCLRRHAQGGDNRRCPSPGQRHPLCTLIDQRKDVSVRADPVGQGDQPGKGMLEPWFVRQIRRVALERLGKPVGQCSAERDQRLERVIAVRRLPQARICCRPLVAQQVPRRAMMRKHRVKQVDDGSPPCRDDLQRQDVKQPADQALFVEYDPQRPDVTRDRERVLAPGDLLVLETAIDLADVMQRGDRRQPRHGYGVQAVAPGKTRQPTCDRRDQKQRLDASRDVGTMGDQIEAPLLPRGLVSL